MATRNAIDDVWDLQNANISGYTTTDKSNLLEKVRRFLDNDGIRSIEKYTDYTLLKFLYARDQNLLETSSLMKNYVTFCMNNADIFEDLTVDDPDIRTALENSLPGLLPYKDRQCRCILVFHANNWDCTFSLTSIFRALICCLEYALNDVHNQNNGFVVIVDWERFTFRQSTYITPSTLRLMVEGLRDCFPAKFKEIHFVAPPWYIRSALQLIKRSFNEEIKENFFVHGRNLSTLHEYIHKEVLPTELGGSKASYNPGKLIRLMESGCNTGELC